MSKSTRIEKFPAKIFDIKGADATMNIINDKEMVIEFKLNGVFAGGCRIKTSIFGHLLIEMLHKDLSDLSKEQKEKGV